MEHLGKSRCLRAQPARAPRCGAGAPMPLLGEAPLLPQAQPDVEPDTSDSQPGRPTSRREQRAQPAKHDNMCFLPTPACFSGVDRRARARADVVPMHGERDRPFLFVAALAGWPAPACNQKRSVRCVRASWVGTRFGFLLHCASRAAAWSWCRSRQTKRQRSR